MGYNVSETEGKYNVSESSGSYTVTQTDDPSVLLTDDYDSYLAKTDIDNGEDNYLIGEPINRYPRYVAESFFCGVPMDSTIQRRAFPSIYKFGDYIFLNYLAGSTHSINALLPYTLEFSRSNDLWKTYETLPIKCINDGGTMRAIDPDTDGFFPYYSTWAYVSGRIWAFFATVELTETPPALGTDWTQGSTYAVYSDDNGDTWSEMIEIDAGCYVTSGADPIVVGSEIWIPTYNLIKSPQTYTDLHSYILRFNYSTQEAGTKTQVDTDWTDIHTAEPTILEYATGKYMCIARVTWNANFPGAEAVHRGDVIAYSADGLDWSNYTFHDYGSGYPNVPQLFMYKDVVYYSYNDAIIHGTVAVDESEIDWIKKATYGSYWWLDYAYTFRQMYAAYGVVGIERYDPREGQEDQAVQLIPAGGTNFCVYDEDSDTLLATRGFKLDGGVYVGEPWIAIIKRNSVGSGPTYTERLIYATEIPGDSNNSNEIAIWNDYIRAGNTVVAYWMDVSGKPTCSISTSMQDYGITFTSSEAVTTAKIVYEIFK
jgi:hypothetical protein